MKTTISLEIALQRLKDKACFLDQSTYVNWKKKARFVCPIYGEWWTLPRYIVNGHWHPKSGNVHNKKSISLRETLERLGDKANWIDQSTYVSFNKDKARFIHPIYGEWWTLPALVVKGRSHPKAGTAKGLNTKLQKYGKQSGFNKGLKTKRFIDRTNECINGYTVVGLSALSNKKWVFRCNICEKIAIVQAGHFNRKASCKCIEINSASKKLYEQYANAKFKQWTVIGVSTRSGCVSCQCSCGTTKDVSYYTLLDGSSTNCGCIQKEKASKRHLKSLIGQQFGHLSVIGRSEERSARTGKRYKWICECICKRIVVVASGHLKHNRQNSCGCMKNINENKCRLIFEELFAHSFPSSKPKWLRNPITGTR